MTLTNIAEVRDVVARDPGHTALTYRKRYADRWCPDGFIRGAFRAAERQGYITSCLHHRARIYFPAPSLRFEP